MHPRASKDAVFEAPTAAAYVEFKSWYSSVVCY